MEDQERTQTSKTANDSSNNGSNFFGKIFGFIRDNKWMTAFIATAVALVVAVTVAIIIGVNSIPDPEPEYTEGNETGVYYYDVADGEILLTLSGANKFTLTGPQMNKTGTYTIGADGKIVLDYIRDEDGTAEATLSGNSIALVLNEQSMTFTKKVKYTVTFNANGGSDVAAVTAINGKTANRPTDPTLNGYAFLGWYTDEALTKVFDFTSATVNADITLYAKWVEDPVGVGKYSVSFDLGYEGAQGYDALTTIAGLAYGVPTPEREGYTFGGWWISAYADAEKLSYKYTESTVFNEDTTLYAVWYQAPADKLAAPMASVNGNSISWDSVSGAISYKLVIKNADGITVLDENVGGSTTKTFDFGAKDAGEYTVSVVAVSADASKNSEETVRYVANKALNKVSKFEVIDGILIFNAVEGATKYLISVDCGNDAHEHTLFDNGQNTSFNIANCPMQIGGIKITVTAQALGYASSTSRTFVYERSLAPIGSVVYNNDTDTVVWDAVAGAISYKVSVKVGDKTYTVNNGTKTSFGLSAYTGEITVSVTPVNAGFNSPAAAELTFTKAAPATPSGITVLGNIISWTASEGATSYEIKIGEITRTSTTNSLDISAEEFEEGVEYVVRVRAIKDAESSAYCEGVSIGYRKMNTTLVYKNNTVYWTPVFGATNYTVTINGDTENAITVNNANSLKIALTKKGVNKIEVKCNDIVGSTVASIEVVAYAVTYMPRNMASELTEYLAIGDAMSLPANYTYAGYDFTNWYSSPQGAAGNGKAYPAGTVFNEQDSITLYADWAPITYSVKLQTEGYEITNVTNQTELPATYTKNYTLPVPVLKEAAHLNFAGWYTGPAGTGDKLTDDKGNSVEPYPFTRDTVAYPFFDTSLLTFSFKANGTYTVSRGPNVDSASTITIPATYKGYPVTTIADNAFASRTKLVSIEIPDTIKLVGTGAFSGCTALQAINVYQVDPEGTYEKFYGSHDGALLRYDMGTTYLEVFPRAKTGVYTIPDEVEVIRNKTFQYSNLSKVIIGKGVTTVAKYGFYYCYDLEEIEFTEGRSAGVILEPYAFTGCSAIHTIKLPNTLAMATEDLAVVLSYMKGLRTIEIEEGGTNFSVVDGMLTNAGETKIVYCPPIRDGELTIPQGISEIGKEAFANNKGITKITIPAYVVSIDEYAFYGCDNVETVEFVGGRRNALEIKKGAFAAMEGLKSVIFNGNGDGTLEEGVITIGASAFYPYIDPDDETAISTKLTTVTFGNGVNIGTIGAHAFEHQLFLSDVSYGENTRIASIGEYAFADNQALKAVKISATTTAVGAYAYAGCSSVTSVTIAEGADAISFGEYAFADCIKLLTIHLPKTVRNFDGSSFAGCDAITRIEVAQGNQYLKNDANGILYQLEEGVEKTLLFYPKAVVRANNGVINNILSTVTKISATVFANNTDLKEITIGKNVTEIGEAAFSNCSKLVKVTFEAGGSELVIGNNAFESCTALKYGTDNATYSFILPAYTKSIGDYAFEFCAFSEFTIPEAVTSIGVGAFSANMNLAEITIPQNVETIGNAAFSYCEKLTTFTVSAPEQGEVAKGLVLGTSTFGAPDEIEPEIGVFYGSTQLTNVNLGGRVTTIGNFAFYGNNKITAVDLGNSLVRIGTYAFFDTALSGITIPNTVVSIGEYAFAVSKADYASIGAKAFKFASGGAVSLAIGEFFINNQTSITEITFPARLGMIYEKETVSTYLTYFSVADRFSGLENLKAINVEAAAEGQTAKFVSIDGILYETDENGNVATLLYCPMANEGKDGTLEVKIPASVRLVARGSFYDVRKITTVTFEEYADTDENYGEPLLVLGCEGVYTSSTSNMYSVFGGATSNGKNSITTINLPSHLGYIGNRGISATKNPLTVNFNEDAKSIELGNYAFYYANVSTLSIPSVSKIGNAIFNNCKSLSSAELDGEFDTITKNMFAGCQALESITIPKEVKYIKDSAFSKCVNLKTVTFEEGSKLEEIGDWSFSNCINLESINLDACVNLNFIGLSSSLTSSGTTFQNCFKLETLDLSKCTNLTTICFAAFKNCTALKEIVFPESLQSMGNSVFENCSSLEKVTLNSTFSPAMLHPADNKSNFFGCTGLKQFIIPETNPYFSTDSYGALYDAQKTIIYFFPASADPTGYEIPSTVTEIASHAFAFFPGDSLTIPEGIEKIGSYAFFHNKFQTITIPASVKTIGSYVFTSDGNKNTASVKKYATDGAPSTYYTYRDIYETNLETVVFAQNSKLETMGGYPFYYASKLTSINLPDTLKSLGTYAFYYCTSLTSITVPAALAELPSYTFYHCDDLDTIVLQEGLKNINTYAFYYAGSKSDKSLSVHIPASVETIGNYAFDNATNLSSLTFDPEGALTSIANYSFRGAAIDRLVFPPNLTTLSSSAFFNSQTIKYVEFTGDSFTDLANQTFKGFTALETVILPESLKTIGSAAFSKTPPASGSDGGLAIRPGGTEYEPCISLTSITIPASVTSIGNYAFAGCTALKTVTFESGSEMVALGTDAKTACGIFMDTPNLETVVLPESLEIIGANAFENSGVKNITLPSSLTTIGNHAFANCDRLVEADIYSNVSYLGDYAFYDCDELTNATPAQIGLEYFGALAFGYCEKLQKAFIPATVTELVGNPYCGCTALSDIELSADSVYYIKTSDGIIYDKDMTTIVYYPATANEKNVTLPDSVTTLAPGAFAGSAIESIYIPARVIEIADNTFMNCKDLTTVTIESGIKSIGSAAFQGCTSLNNVVIPMSASIIGDYAFAGCTSLSNVAFEPTNAKSPYTLGTHIFEGCSSMTSMVLPTHWVVTEADINEYSGLSFVGEITILGNFLPSYMFAGTGITEAVIPENVTYISNEGVFKDCKNLRTVTFAAPKLVNATVGSYFFYGCSSLENLTIKTSASMNPFGNAKGYTFAYCTSLKSFTYYQTYSELQLVPVGDPENHFEGCTSLEEVKGYRIAVTKDTADAFEFEIQSELYVDLKSGMFKGCTALKSFRFTDSETVPPHAFEGSGLTELTITPASLGTNAFKDCVNIKNAYLYPYHGSGTSTGGTILRPLAITGAVVGKPIGGGTIGGDTTVSTTTKTGISKFYPGVFSGWTEEQNIFIMTMTRDQFIAMLAANTNDDPATIDEVFEGCNAKIYFKDQILAMDEITLGGMSTEIENGFFNSLKESQKVTFTLYGYDELYDKLSAKFFGTSVAKFFDKDGNALVYDAETKVVSVINAEGKTIALYVYDVKVGETEEDSTTPTTPSKPSLKLAIDKIPVGGGTTTETEEEETFDVAATVAKLVALGLKDLQDLEFVYLDTLTFADIALMQKDLTSFEAFVGIGANVKFYDMDDNIFEVDPTTGLLKNVYIVDPAYYLISGSEGKLTIGGSANVYGSTIYKYDFTLLGAGVTVYIQGTQTYEDVLFLKEKAADIFKGCAATVYDCEGNKLVFNADGLVEKVLDPDGEEIYTKPAEDTEDENAPGTGSGSGTVGGGTLRPVGKL